MAISKQKDGVAGQPIHFTVNEAASAEACRSLHEIAGRANSRGKPSTVFSGEPRRSMSLHGKHTIRYIADFVLAGILCAVDIFETDDMVNAGELTKKLRDDWVDV